MAHRDELDQGNGPYGQIMLFGDSITENSWDHSSGFSYAGALSHAFKRRLDVVNRGFSYGYELHTFCPNYGTRGLTLTPAFRGYNTDHAIAVLPKFLPTPDQAKIELLIICFGANDSCVANDPTGHHVPLEKYYDNLHGMITDRKVQAHQPQVLLVTPPPINEHQRILADQARGISDGLRRTVENTECYAAACKGLGAALDVPVVDIWTTFLQHAGWVEGETNLGSHTAPVNKKFEALFTDGLHLSSSGYKLVYEGVLKAIKSHFPLLDPEGMKYVHPVWEIAPKDSV